MNKSDLKREDCESDLAFSLLNPEHEAKALRLEAAAIRLELAGIRELMAKQLAAYLSKEVPEENKKDGFVVEVLNTPITLSRKPEFQYE